MFQIYLKRNIILGYIELVNPNPGLKSRNSQWIFHFQGGCERGQGSPNSTHKNMPDRLDVLCFSRSTTKNEIVVQ